MTLNEIKNALANLRDNLGHGLSARNIEILAPELWVEFNRSRLINKKEHPDHFKTNAENRHKNACAAAIVSIPEISSLLGKLSIGKLIMAVGKLYDENFLSCSGEPVSVEAALQDLLRPAQQIIPLFSVSINPFPALPPLRFLSELPRGPQGCPGQDRPLSDYFRF